MSFDNLFDLLALLLLTAAFIFGYLQGSVRRVLGIASILFSLVLAAQVRGPLGDFLVANWTQFPADYSRMLAFGLVFVVVSVAFTIVIQAYYERSAVLPRYPLVDPLLGGLLGIVEAGIVIGALVLILDSYFRGGTSAVRPGELLFLRDFNHAVDVSLTAKLFRHDLIPVFFFFLGGLIPEEIRKLFPA